MASTSAAAEALAAEATSISRLAITSAVSGLAVTSAVSRLAITSAISGLTVAAGSTVSTSVGTSVSGLLITVSSVTHDVDY